MSIKNAIINHTNTANVAVPAEIQVRYRSVLLEDPTNYKVAVTSTSIDISEMPILTFSDDVDSYILPMRVVYRRADQSFVGYTATKMQEYNLRGMSFKNVYEFHAHVQSVLDKIFRNWPEASPNRAIEYDLDLDTFNIGYFMRSTATHIDMTNYDAYATFAVSGELINIFKAYTGKMVTYRPNVNVIIEDTAYLPDFGFPTTFDPAYPARGTTPTIKKPKSDIMTNLYNWSALIYKTDMSINATSFYHEQESPGGRDESILLYINLPRLASPYIIYSPDQLRWNSFTNDIDITSVFIKVYIMYNNGSTRDVLLAPGAASNVQMSFRKDE